MTTQPATYNFDFLQGDTFNDVWTIKDSSGTAVDLTGYTARMFIRESVEDSATLLEITSANSRIALGGAAGTVTFSVSASLTNTLPAKSCVYDFELTSGGVVTTWLRGNIVVHKKVTR